MFGDILANKALVTEFVKVSTMFVVSRLLAGGDLTDKKWMMASLYTTFGFTVFHLIKQFIPTLSANAKITAAINTAAHIATMSVVSRLLMGEPMNKQWMMSSLYTIVGFVVANPFVADMVPLDFIQHEGLKASVKDLVIVSSMSVVVRLLEGKSLSDKNWQMGILYTSAGFALYNLVLNRFIN
tara:strand:+ start:205 stop:753 length:549 start_codon:yes stop_codon:yes gene_type:complete